MLKVVILKFHAWAANVFKWFIPTLSIAVTFTAACVLDHYGLLAKWQMPLLWFAVVTFATLEIRKAHLKDRYFWLIFGTALLFHITIVWFVVEIYFPAWRMQSTVAVVLTFLEVYGLSIILSGKNLRHFDRCHPM